MEREENGRDWAGMTAEEKRVALYWKQRRLLEDFLARGAIGRAQYEKSLGDLTEKMGMEKENRA